MNKSIKKTLTLLTTLVLLIISISGTALAAEFDASPYEDMGIYIIERSTGKVLVESNADLHYAPLSVTKLLTTMLVLDTLQATDEVTISGDVLALVNADASKAKLAGGEILTVEQLVYAMLLPSGNDAARAAAVAAGRKLLGKESTPPEKAMQAFVDKMNEKAKAIGAKDSHFLNPDGYPKAGMYSTAKDITTISLYAIDNYPLIQTAATTSHVTIKTNLAEHSWSNSNILTHGTVANISFMEGSGANVNYDPRINGLKTGSGGKARAFAFNAKKGENELIGSVLNVKNDSGETIFTVAQKLTKWYFNDYIPLQSPESASVPRVIKALPSPPAKLIPTAAAATTQGFKLDDNTLGILLIAVAAVLLLISIIAAASSKKKKRRKDDELLFM
ncbi:MAG: hypothetical protein LBS74_09935 [Oscillospiraceae bacterium]|jgi:D-alanyl-D-alanine carboxypeptidase (penicillin-binding protein 5/6)|nr:hypothetical protein [Oscillospiraceae bacterium]